MKQHPRTSIYNTARHAVSGLLLDLERRLELHYEEIFSCLVERLDALTRGMRADLPVAAALDAACAIVPQQQEHFCTLLTECREGLIQLQRTHELSYGEWLSILSNEIAGFAKYFIRHERHPDEPDKPGDEA